MLARASPPSKVKQDEFRLTCATSTNTHLVAAAREGAAANAVVGINQGGGGTTTTLDNLNDMCISASYHHSGASAPSTVKQDVCRLSYATSTNTHLVVAVGAGAAAVAIVGINQGRE